MIWLAGMLGLMAVGSMIFSDDLSGDDGTETGGGDDAPPADLTASQGPAAQGSSGVSAGDGPTGPGDGKGGLILPGGPLGEALAGSAGDDQINGHDGDDLIVGRDGQDDLFGGAGEDTLQGGGGEDTLHGEDGEDMLRGEDGNDLLSGHSGSDSLLGGAGEDTLQGGLGDDWLSGGAGRDALHGNHGADRLEGGGGQDTLFGGWGDDVVSGAEDGAIGDFLNGGGGEDTILAGANDTVTGGEGADRLVLGDWIAQGNACDLRDFDPAEDRLLVLWDLARNPDPEIEIVEDSADPGLRIPNMFAESIDGRFRGMFVQGEDIAQSDPNTRHVNAALEALECLIVQDLFLNETAAFAHVFFPGTSFLEKDGTFTNAERRINRVRPVMAEKSGMAEWEVVCRLAHALGYDMHYDAAAEIMDEIARLTPSFAGVSFKRLDEAGSLQWPVNEAAPDGTPTMHIGGFVRGKGNFVITEYVPTEERTNRSFPLILTTGRILSQYNVGAQTRRTENSRWHETDELEMHPFDAEERGLADGDMVSIQSRIGAVTLPCKITDRMPQGVVYTTFHHPVSGANVITTENSDWATNCPEYKVTAVQISRSNQPSDWQREFETLHETNYTMDAAE